MFKRLLGKESIVQDSSIYSNQDYSDLILDSASIEHYIAKDTALEDFFRGYSFLLQQKKFQSAWFTNKEMSNSTDAFFSTLNDYQLNFEDTSLVRPHLISLWNQAKADSSFFAKNPAERLKFELGLTSTFFNMHRRLIMAPIKIQKTSNGLSQERKKIISIS
jgi:hypothetical protein